MHEPFPDLAAPETVETPAGPRGRPVLAWTVILVMVVLITVLQSMRSRARTEEKTAPVSMTTVLQGRMLVGFARFVGMAPADAYAQDRPLNTGPVEQRLCFVILAGELMGPAEALRQLHLLREALPEHGIEPTPTQAALLDDLRKLYNDYQEEHFTAPSLDDAARERLRHELGWFGELALAPPDTPDTAARAAVLAPARRMATALLILAGLVLGLGLGSLVVLAGLLVLFVGGALRGGLVCGQPHGAVYAETFALWMLLFPLLALLGALVPAGDARLAASGAGALLSLVVLAWPVVRGVPWQQVREDIGLTAGRRGLLEMGFGPICYLASLPLVLGAAVVVLILLAVQGQLAGRGGSPADDFSPGGAPPARPIVDEIARGNWGTWVLILMLACVVAPLVEEVLFRGVLYRHLREATCRLRMAWSILLSAGVSSFLFAVIHPQGLIAVPLLMALAFGFALAREWRGTLLPAIVAHGINNGLVLLLTILLLGS
jgi:membrane protease YdiL (CAAX protease family)